MTRPQIRIQIPASVAWASGEISGSLTLEDGSGKEWQAIRLDLEETPMGGDPRILGGCRLKGPFNPSEKAVKDLNFRLGFHRPEYRSRHLFGMLGKWGSKVAEGLDFLRTSGAKYHIAVYLETTEGEELLVDLFPVKMV